MPHYGAQRAQRGPQPSQPRDLIRRWAYSDFGQSKTKAETSRRLALLAQLAEFEGENQLAKELSDVAAQPYTE